MDNMFAIRKEQMNRKLTSLCHLWKLNLNFHIAGELNKPQMDCYITVCHLLHFHHNSLTKLSYRFCKSQSMIINTATKFL
jgi:hypothetical protein